MLFREQSWSRMLEPKWSLLSSLAMSHRLQLVPSTMSPVVVILAKTSLRLIKPARYRGGSLPTSSINSVDVATPHHEQRLFCWHGRVACRATTVPESRWHGVSRRGVQMRGCRSPSPNTGQQRLRRTPPTPAFVRNQGSSPMGHGRTRPPSRFFCSPPYFFGMVKICEPSHKGLSRELCEVVGGFI